MTDKPVEPTTKKIKPDPKKVSVTKPTVEKKPTAKVTPEKATESNGKTNLGTMLFILLSLINLSAVAYLWYFKQQTDQLSQTTQQQQQQLQQQQQQQLSEMAAKNQQQQQLLDEIRNHNQSELNQLKQKLENLDRITLTMQSQLNLTQQKINQTGKGVTQDLLLTEADFLIRTAAIRLLLTQNTSETSNLLKAADNKLLKINDVAIFPVRAALTKDLYQLKSSTQIDVIGTYLILENMEKTIDQLKINFILPEQQLKQKSDTPKSNDWLQHFSETSKNVIDQWFQVTHYKEEIKPLVSRQQDLMIKQSIVLIIKQAQWALIQNNTELYQLTLKNLGEQIKASFNKEDPIVIATLVEIKTLLSESIITPVEKYLNSEKAMKQYMGSISETQTERPAP
jgi:uroporphyrin-3 C-methyltransferase